MQLWAIGSAEFGVLEAPSTILIIPVYANNVSYHHKVGLPLNSATLSVDCIELLHYQMMF